MQFLIKSSKKF